jgi:hypothetical protein
VKVIRVSDQRHNIAKGKYDAAFRAARKGRLFKGVKR